MKTDSFRSYERQAGNFEWICRCGDWVSDHPDRGPCQVCRSSPNVQDNCKRYRPWKIEERFYGGEHFFEQMISRG